MWTGLNPYQYKEIRKRPLSSTENWALDYATLVAKLGEVFAGFFFPGGRETVQRKYSLNAERVIEMTIDDAMMTIGVTRRCCT